MDVPGSGLREIQSTNSLHLYEGVRSLQRTSGHMRELGRRRFGVMSLWWLKEPSPRKAGIDITLRAATTRDSNSIWIFSVLNLCTFLVRHHLYSSLKITFSTRHSTCVLLASTFSNSSLRRQILMIYLDPGLIFSRQKHHWSTLGQVTVLGQMSMAKERGPIRT